MLAFPAILEQFFQLEEHNSDVVTELRAGVLTFFTLSYIIFVQPAVLSSAGMDFGAVMTATCLASAIGCLIMGLWANYPIALAPGMGINFYFTYTVSGAGNSLGNCSRRCFFVRCGTYSSYDF